MGGRRAGAAWLFVTVLALTAVAAFPVLQHPTERIYGAEIVGRHHDPFTVMRQFDGQLIPSPYLQPATDWLGRGLAWVVGAIPAYNVVVLWTFPLAALFAFLFALAVTGSRLAGWIAGLAFAFSPFHVAQSAYHPHIAQVQWMPLYFLALWRVTHGATWPRIALLVVSTALVCLSNFYGALIAMSLTPIAIAGFWLAPDPSGGRGSTRDLACGSAAWLAMVAAGLLAIWFVAPGVLQGQAPRVSAIGELASYSARAISYVLPPVDHPQLGETAARYWQLDGNRIGALEQQITIGYGVLMLVVIAGWLAWRKRTETLMAGRTVAALAAIGGFAFLCSLAPEGQFGSFTWPRPSAWLYALAPMFRSYARYAVVVQLMVVVLAGAGAAGLWRRGGVLRRAIVVMTVGLTVWLYAPIAARSRDVMPTEAHRWLASGQPVSRLLECRPALLADFHTAWLLHRPVEFLADGDEDCAAPDIGLRMRAQQTSHLLIRRNRREYHWLPEHPREDLRLRIRLDDGAVWDVPPVPAFDPYVARLDGPYPREYDDEKSWRWMGERATWSIVNPRSVEGAFTMRVELTALARPRAFAIEINGVAVMTAQAGTARSFLVIPLTLRSGSNVMTWRALEPLDTPDAIGHNGDTRGLSLSIGDWKIVGRPGTRQ